MELLQVRCSGKSRRARDLRAGIWRTGNAVRYASNLQTRGLMCWFKRHRRSKRKGLKSQGR